MVQSEHTAVPVAVAGYGATEESNVGANRFNAKRSRKYGAVLLSVALCVAAVVALTLQTSSSPIEEMSLKHDLRLVSKLEKQAETQNQALAAATVNKKATASAAQPSAAAAKATASAAQPSAAAASAAKATASAAQPSAAAASAAKATASAAQPSAAAASAAKAAASAAQPSAAASKAAASAAKASSAAPTASSVKKLVDSHVQAIEGLEKTLSGAKDCKTFNAVADKIEAEIGSIPANIEQNMIKLSKDDHDLIASYYQAKMHGITKAVFNSVQANAAKCPVKASDNLSKKEKAIEAAKAKVEAAIKAKQAADAKAAAAAAKQAADAAAKAKAQAEAAKADAKKKQDAAAAAQKVAKALTDGQNGQDNQVDAMKNKVASLQKQESTIEKEMQSATKAVSDAKAKEDAVKAAVARVEKEKAQRIEAIKKLTSEESDIKAELKHLVEQKKKDQTSLGEEQVRVQNLENQAKAGIEVVKTLENSVSADNTQITARTKQDVAVANEIKKLQQ